MNIIPKKKRVQREVGRGRTRTWERFSKGELKEADLSNDLNKENFWEGGSKRGRDQGDLEEIYSDVGEEGSSNKY